MRKLIYIPVIHTSQDLGEHLEKVREKYIARYGLQKWRQHIREVDELWQKIREELMKLQVDYSKVKIYQDALPVCGREVDIINKLADDGSLNHQILRMLIEKGATLIGTESPDLLIQERNRLNSTVRKNSLLYDELMKERDKYIAQRIDSTLEEDEMGLLFMGALHRVVEKLSDDIRVYSLLDETK